MQSQTRRARVAKRNHLRPPGRQGPRAQEQATVPGLGYRHQWAPSAVPFSIAARLILPVHIDRAPSGAEFGSLKEWLIDKDVMVKWWSKGQGGWFAASVVDYNADENKFKVSRIRSQIVLATTSLTRCVPRSDASSSMKLTALRSGESSLQRNIQRSLL